MCDCEKRFVHYNMEKLHKLFIRLCLVILPAMNCIQSEQPFGYIGCYKQDTLGKDSNGMLIRYNNGVYCINFCMLNGYRYAGTQVQNCRCGKKLLTDSQQSTCKIKCAGQRSELCGGENSMSIYDISLIQDTEDSSSVSTNSASTNSVPTTPVPTTSVSTTPVSKTAMSTTSVPTTAKLTTLVSTISVPTISVSTTSPPTISLPTTSVPTTLVSTTSPPTISVPTTSVPTTLVSKTSAPTISVPTISVPTTSLPTSEVPTQFYQHKEEITDDLVSVYVSVPIVIVFVVAIVLVVMIFLKRKRRRNGEQCTCLRRKKVENYKIQATTNKTYNINSLNDDDSCFRYSPENVENSSTNIYAEIKFGSTQSIETSENSKTGQSTFSCGVPIVRDEAGTSCNIGIYDTLQTCAKANNIKISDCSKSVYDHVIVGHHNNQITGINEYSHIGAVQIHNVQQIQYKIKDKQNQRDNRSDRSSADCGDPDGRTGKNSADCGDQDGRIGKSSADCGDPDGKTGKSSANCGDPDGRTGKSSADFGDPDGRTGKSSADCGEPDGRTGKSSADCGDQDNQLYHDYVKLEPEGQFIVK